ncbi:MAG: glycosyltransferase family 4 protein [Pyrinomonadaceae bacterium]|nr:glycosyltransferase family 4 protein [Pyrinomonadaceae bacterium]
MQRTFSEYEVYGKLKNMSLEKKVLHIESAPWQSWILLFFLSKMGNVFVTMHNALPPEVPKWRKKIWSKRLNLLLSRKKFHFFAANQNAIDSLKDYVSEVFQNKLILTRATINPAEIEGVNNKKIDICEIKKKHSIPVDKFIVLCVGQFIDRKGRWIYLETAKQILRTNKELFFVWLTPQLPDQNDLKKIESFELGDSFRLIKSENVGKTRDEILSFFKVADVFTLPSLWEGLPIAILEAMALGLPTVSTNLNAIPEAVIDGETGILVETGNAEQLKTAILRLYENEALRKKLAETGKSFVLDKFDERKMAEIVLENYEKCLLP